MKVHVMTVLCVCVAAAGWVQVRAAAPGAGRYVGVVDATNVYVRYNASTNAYPCTKLSRPDRVTVVASRSPWLEILPPPGVFSVIAKEFVDPDAAGTGGVVTGSRVWVRAGGDLRDNDFTGLQVQLNSGDKVSIIGQATSDLSGQKVEFYKIAPPAGVHFYISEQYVKPVDGATPAPAAATETPPPAGPRAAGPATALDATVATAPAAPTTVTATVPVTAVATSEPADMAAAMEQFRAAEAELIKEFGLPLAARDYQKLTDNFKALKAPEGSHLQPFIKYYLDYIDYAQSKEADREQFQALVRSAAALQAQYDMRRTKIEVSLPARPGNIFAGEGILSASAIYTGSHGSPKRYVLRDARSGAIDAYVVASEGGADLSRFAGKNVGIMGTSRYDRDTMTEIISAEQVVLLEDQPSLPAPPAPTIGPLPPMPVSAPAAVPSAPVEAPKPPAAAPTTAPARTDAATPRPAEMSAGKPDFTAPATRPAPVAAAVLGDPLPVVRPEPTTRPGVAKPLPPSGLPVVKQTVPGAIVEEEYD
jgi:hypothetical protein